MRSLIITTAAAAALIALTAAGPTSRADDPRDDLVRVRSAFPVGETVERIKADVAAKGIRFFTAIDQAALAHDAGIKLRPSTLLLFGNPPLGAQFLASNPDSGLDWPVRLLVRQEADGSVWAVYTNFRSIARRYAIADRDAQFLMASDVVASITSSVAQP